MKSKYYTPTIEEFHVGFEFEFFDEDDRDWTEVRIESQESLCNWTGMTIEKRVKYLDKEDIESLGFIYYEDTSIGDGDIRWWDGFKQDSYEIRTCTEWDGYNTIITKHGRLIFEGTIKNKSELKILLKQINI